MLIKIFLLACLLINTSQVWADIYTLKWKANGEIIAESELTISDGFATARTGEEVERFNLDKLSWQHDDSEEWVSLAQCEQWAEQSKLKSENSNEVVPEKIRSFLAWSLNPTFKVEATNTTLSMISGQIDYVVTSKRGDLDLTSYFLFAKLNAYKKAMTERKLMPFAELHVLKELERRKLMPASMEVRIPGIEGAPTMTVTIETNR